jgi:hypothetical protein
MPAMYQLIETRNRQKVSKALLIFQESFRARVGFRRLGNELRLGVVTQLASAHQLSLAMRIQRRPKRGPDAGLTEVVVKRRCTDLVRGLNG